MVRTLYLQIIVISMLGWSFASQSQSKVSGWQVDTVHGPSQQGIADSIALDFNQDGRLDVASVSYNDGHLRLYLNQGNLVFDQQIISTDLFGAFRIVKADLNDDNEFDFIVPSIETSEIIAVMSGPDGHEKQVIASGVLVPSDAQVGFLNDDDLLDVASTSFQEGLLLAHLQQIDGSFETEIISDVPVNPRKMVLEDFDNDGLVDVLLASSGDDSIRLFTKQQNDGYVETLISNQALGTRYTESCDVNGDMLPDFVVSASDANTIWVYTNLGSNTFSQTELDNDVAGVRSLYCVDIDDDGQQELLNLAAVTGVIYAHELKGPVNRVEVASNRDGYVNVKAGVFTGDQTSLLTQTFFDNRNLLYDPLSTNQEQVVWEDFPDGASDVKMGDINNDGVEDLVASSFRDDRVQWYDGTTFQHHIIAENIDGAAEVLVVDLDDDGWVDVLSAASFANTFYWHRNTGNEVFNTLVIFDDARFANGLAVADLDEDGQLDVVGTSGSDDSVRLFTRNGVSFTVQLLDDQNDAPNEVKIYDMDGDMDLDLVVPYTFSDELVMYENLGGAFSSQVLASNLDRIDSTAITDINNDGFMDILASVAGDDVVVKLINQANGVFVQEPLIQDIETPKRIKFNSATPYNFLQTNFFPNGVEVASIYNLGGVPGDYGDLLFEFSNALSNSSHVFLASLQDLIYADGFQTQQAFTLDIDHP